MALLDHKINITDWNKIEKVIRKYVLPVYLEKLNLDEVKKKLFLRKIEKKLFRCFGTIEVISINKFSFPLQYEGNEKYKHSIL